ncbi:glycosyltransferase [Bifidobacterium scaligerum]|uniref:Glycosyltransferase 2-like domain-containing protein n=1 Tax=Bifidobacterium scaligerum TaxID=2052656 RepID=A0A2M9HPB7_9BIFI|nr:glycosyltransferase [Bifidobacterium scaligerum]PJM78654.1 hypothetical protein CUU80_07890 [Bifidobacterium scaligerum]
MKTAVLLVTFNRLDCLKITLDKYDNQTVAPDLILVIDNASTDDTPNYLNEWEHKDAAYGKKVIRLKQNTGGSGGFAAGFDYLEHSDYDWMLVADDDAYPETTTIERLERAVAKYAAGADVAALCTTVLNNGQPDRLQRRRWSVVGPKVFDKPCTLEEYKNEVNNINVLTFVGAFINIKAAKAAGLPEAGFFIYYDDVDYSLRLAQQGRILFLPDICMHHDTGFSVRNQTTWKSYYYLRNKLLTYKHHGGVPAFIFELCVELLKKVGPLSAILKKRTKEERTLYWHAIQDAVSERLGLHSVYRPGWKPNNR